MQDIVDLPDADQLFFFGFFRIEVLVQIYDLDIGVFSGRDFGATDAFSTWTESLFQPGNSWTWPNPGPESFCRPERDPPINRHEK